MTSRRRWYFSLLGARVLVCAVIAAGMMVAPRAAGAQAPEKNKKQDKDKVAKYERLVKEGETLFNEKSWAEARASFEMAYSVHPVPLLLFNIASTYRREGLKEEAVKYYKKYLEVAPPDAEYRRIAEEAVITIEDQIAAEKRATPPPPREKPSSSSSTLLRYSGMGMGVVGVAVLSFGIYQGLEARKLNDKFENLAPNTEWTQELQDDFDEGESREQQAIIFSVVGGVALAFGGALYVAGVLSERDAPSEREISLVPIAGPDGAGMVLSGSF